MIGEWADTIRHIGGVEYINLAASDARVDAVSWAGLEAAADECNKTAVEARQYGLPELAIGACKCRDDIRALAADPAAVARIAKGVAP